VRLRELVETSVAVGATRSRTAKRDTLAALLAATAPEEVPAAVAFGSGTLLQLVHGLLARADADEQRFLIGLLLGDLGQGALAGVMVEGVARAAGPPAAEVRRALMLRGDLPAVAALALSEGSAGLGALRLEVGRPVAPMLAGTAADRGAALSRIVPAAVEWKLDGARIQVHRDGEDVQIFTRTLDEVTPRLPEVVAAVRALPARSLVLDAEVIALAQDGRPRPFQVTAARFGARRDVEALRRATPLTPFLFDVLHRDGEDLLDAPASARAEHLAALAPAALRVPRVLAGDLGGAWAVLDDALARGHEGVMVKSLDAPYAAGRRGSEWLKVKPVHTLDLVVLAAEWGHGRRRGSLSNLHLGTCDGMSWAMLGKTFKGLTDPMLAWQTERLLALEERRDSHTVHVRPELVVEIARDGVQLSTRYASGFALRFARVQRYREDKAAAEADTLDAVRALAPQG